MRYQPTYDQVIVHDLGLKSNHGHMLDMIVNAATWADSKEIDGEKYYLLEYGKVISELPTVFGSKQAITRVTQKLEQLKLIEVIMSGRMNYFRAIEDIKRFWCKNNKSSADYESFRKRNDQDISDEPPTVPKTEQSDEKESFRKRNVPKTDHSDNGTTHSENGTETPEIVPKTESINQLNQSTNQSTSPGGRFVDFFNAYPKKAKEEEARVVWEENNLDEIADLIIDDVEFRKTSHSKWINGFPHNPDNYLAQKLWNQPVIFNDQVVTKPGKGSFQSLEIVLDGISKKFDDISHELNCSHAQSIWRMCVVDYKAGRLELDKAAFLEAAKAQYRVDCENR